MGKCLNFGWYFINNLSGHQGIQLLTQCGLLTLYGDRDLGQYWLKLMACCLMTPSHYLNQCWLIISEAGFELKPSPSPKYTRFSKGTHICLMKSLIIMFPMCPIWFQDPILKMLSSNPGDRSPVTFILEQFHKRCLNSQSLNLFEYYISNISFKFPRGQWVKSLWPSDAIWRQAVLTSRGLGSGGSPDSNFTLSIQATMLHNEFENYCKISDITYTRSQNLIDSRLVLQ